VCVCVLTRPKTFPPPPDKFLGQPLDIVDSPPQIFPWILPHPDGQIRSSTQKIHPLDSSQTFSRRQISSKKLPQSTTLSHKSPPPNTTQSISQPVGCLFYSSLASGSTSISINEVNLHRARSVPGWLTVSGFNSQCRAFMLVCDQPPTSTQPGHPSVGRRSEYTLSNQRVVTPCV